MPLGERRPLQTGISSPSGVIFRAHPRQGTVALPREPQKPTFKVTQALPASSKRGPNPVVIMAVTRGERCLLGRQKGWPTGMYSALAGFVEVGETIEEAVRREVFEEAGIRVGAVRYLHSQPWPFPSSLMIGCIGEAESEEISVDFVELQDAKWIDREQVRKAIESPGSVDGFFVPPAMSIAHHLLRHWAL